METKNANVQTTNHRIVITLCHANGRAHACIPIHTHFPNIATAARTIADMKENDAQAAIERGTPAIPKRYDIYPFIRYKNQDGTFAWIYRNYEITSNEKCNRFKAFHDGHMVSNRQRLDKVLDDIDRIYVNQEIRMG